MLFADWLETPIGPLLVAASETHLLSIEFRDGEPEPAPVERLGRKLGLPIGEGMSPALQQAEPGGAAIVLHGGDFALRESRQLRRRERVIGNVLAHADAVELVRPQQGVVKPFAIKRDIKRIADRDCVIREVFDRTGLREEAPIEPVHPAWPSFPLRSFHLPKHRRHMPNGRVIRVRHLAHELDRGSFDLSDLERGNSEVPER